MTFVFPFNLNRNEANHEKKKKKERKMSILLNASKGLCLAPVLIKGKIYWSLCLRRKSGSDYQIAHQRQVLM